MTSDSFVHARAQAKPDCQMCHGTGEWKYDRDHSRICPRCCKHDRGWWKLSPGHEGWKQGHRWCCLAGCGLAFRFNPDTWVPPRPGKVVAPEDPGRNPWAWSPGPQKG